MRPNLSIHFVSFGFALPAPIRWFAHASSTHLHARLTQPRW
jgi:hypothetical protein